jgi:hypothetical protein
MIKKCMFFDLWFKRKRTIPLPYVKADSREMKPKNIRIRFTFSVNMIQIMQAWNVHI